ncbi:MAG TPA: efflux transporter outer membrane subunit [Caulobacteraceae bacterium]
MQFLRPPVRVDVAARITGLAAAASSLALLTACAPDLGQLAQVKPPTDYAAQKALGAPTATAWPAEDWWTAYNDPQLTGLIEEALKGAPDLKAAEARVREAQAQVQVQGAPLLPTVGVSGNIQETGVELNVKGIPDNFKSAIPSDLQPFTQLSGKVAYEIDFFGKNRAAVAAASSEQKAAEFELRAARLQISTAVASAYADLVRLTADRQAAEDAIKVRGDTLTLVADRVKNGLENQGQQAQSSAEKNVSQGDLAAIDAQIDRTRHQLAALVGAGPDRGLDVQANLGSISAPWGLPSNLPADLIGRRPDVAAARLRAEAAAQKVKSAHAAFYPNINLNASVLDLSFSPEKIFTQNVVLAQFGPAISIPIFQGGRLTGAYRGAAAEYEAAVASYDKAVSDSLKDVADAVSMQKALAVQMDYADKAVADSRKAYDLAVLRYKGGLSPYLVVLTAQSTLIAQERTAADLKAQTLAANVSLVRALGGGFIAPAVAETSKTSNEKGSAHG